MSARGKYCLVSLFEHYSTGYRRPHGMYLSIDHPERIEEAFRQFGAGPDDIDLLVATDTEEIPGIGDWGVGGIGNADRIRAAMIMAGLSQEKATRNFWCVDIQGLLLDDQSELLRDFQNPYEVVKLTPPLCHETISGFVSLDGVDWFCLLMNREGMKRHPCATQSLLIDQSVEAVITLLRLGPKMLDSAP